VDPVTACVVAVEGGRIVGYADAELRVEEDRVWGFASGAVHPDVRRRGIGRALWRAADANFLERARPHAGPRAVFLQRYLIDSCAGAAALARSEGFRELRRSVRLQVALDALPDVPDPGVAIRDFDPDRDGRAVHDADQDAFLDGGGERRRVPWEEWRARRMTGPSYDPRLWLVAVEGGRVAGYCIGMPWGEDRPDFGWIARLGVLRAWRGRGLGRALSLYRGAGMEVFARYTHWRRMFAGAEEIVS
jgi:ribosomal protein S18 acetylase RimI-like enzyme